jgi:hypothetical protein
MRIIRADAGQSAVATFFDLIFKNAAMTNLGRKTEKSLFRFTPNRIFPYTFPAHPTISIFAETGPKPANYPARRNQPKQGDTFRPMLVGFFGRTVVNTGPFPTLGESRTPISASRVFGGGG